MPAIRFRQAAQVRRPKLADGFWREIQEKIQAEPGPIVDGGRGSRLAG